MKSPIAQTVFHSLITAGILFVFLIVYTLLPIENIFDKGANKRTFQVQGTGTVDAAPSKYQVDFSVNETGSTQQEAQSKGNEKQQEALAKLEDLGFQKKDIQTTVYNVSPQYDYASGRNRITGYQITIGTLVSSTELSKINQAIDELVALNINVGNVNSTFEDDSNLKDEARKKAVEEAKKKAQSLAQAAGFRLGSIASIQETDYPIIFDSRTAVGSAAEEKIQIAPPTDIQPGERSVTSNVTITYYILD